MTRIIAIASGKGGVGKTSLTANIGIALAKMGKKVIIVDSDLQMANLGLLLGMEGRPITLQDVLAGEASLSDAIYDGPGGVRFVPAGLSIEKFRRVDDEKLADVIKELAKGADLILLDTAAGIGNDVLTSLHSATEVLVVTMAESAAVADALKLIMIAERRLGLDITGVVVEMYKDMKQEMTAKEIQKALQTDVLAVIPEDPQFRECSLEGNPVVLKHPTSAAGTAIINLAAKLIGAPPPMIEAEKRGIIDIIMALLSPKKKPAIKALAKGEEEAKETPAKEKPAEPKPKEEPKAGAPAPEAKKAPAETKTPTGGTKAPDVAEVDVDQSQRPVPQRPPTGVSPSSPAEKPKPVASMLRLPAPKAAAPQEKEKPAGEKSGPVAEKPAETPQKPGEQQKA